MKCPMCDGEGSFQDDVLWKGIGGDHSDDCIYQKLWKKTQPTEVK